MSKNEKAGGIKDFPVHTENPFLERLRYESRGKGVSISKGAIPLSVVGDENLRQEAYKSEAQAFISIRKEVDTAKFTKIFLQNIQEMFKLKNPGLRVFGYFLNASKINDDKVLFSLEDCMEFCGYKTGTSVYKGLRELLENEFVARTKQPNVYYINLAIFFNGDRLYVIRQYTKRNGAERFEEEKDSLTAWKQPSIGSEND
jgi:hypothetical protein